MFYHFQFEIGGALGRSSILYGVIRHGDMAVDLFFVMSGFVLSLQYKERFARRIRAREYWGFMCIRLARIYPLHLLVLVAFISIPLAIAITGRAPAQGFSGRDLVLSALLIQNWGFSNPLPWNGPAWSISAEFFFYFLFPFAAYAINWCARDLAGLLLVLVALVVAILVIAMVVDGAAVNFNALGLFRCVTGCLAGMWVREVWARWQPSGYVSMLLIAAAFGVGTLFGVGAISQLVAAPLAFVLLVLGLLNEQDAISRMLSNPVLLWMGRVSFSTYIIHYFVRDWLRMLFLGQMPLGALLGLYVGILLVASAILYHLVEVPGQRMGRTLARRLFDGSEYGPRSAVTDRLPIAPADTLKDPGR